MTSDTPDAHPLRNLLLALPILALACAGEDPASADTDASTGAATESPTSAADDAPPPGDSTMGDPQTTAPESDAGTGSGIDGGSESSSVSSSDDGTSECRDDLECADPSLPFCVGGRCASCGAAVDPDAACAQAYPETPVCVADECVQCSEAEASACTGTTPLCDAATNTCTACTSHAQCPDSACHISHPDRPTDLDGSCFDPANVVGVDGDGGQDYTTITQAVAAFGPNDEGVIVVHESTTPYDETVTVDGGRVLAMMAATGQEPTWIQPTLGGESQLTVLGASTVVFLHGMTLSDNANSSLPALDVAVARVHVQRSAIVANAGGAINAQDAALVHLENSFFGGSETNAGVIVISGSHASLLYSTSISGTSFSVRSLSCNNGGTANVRNSILLGAHSNPSVNCSGAVFENCASDQDLGFGNATVLDFGPGGSSWFDDAPAGDFHFNNGAMTFCLVGVWETGDPAIDIDGDPRPNVNAAPDCAGADVP
jgi:hypothetical protein